jgi:hypothetical protein
MAGRDSMKRARSANVGRRLLVGMGAGAGVFFAAAAMATGSAAPAKADFEDLLDPIIQPLLTSFTDAISGFDPAAATDLTSWTDSLLASLNSIDLAVPAASEPAAAAAAAEPAAVPSYVLPLTFLDTPATEPAVNASIDGGSSVPVLVDTGSAGLVVPWQDLGSDSEFQDLLNLGFPTGISESGYSGGVDYIYLTYNDVPVTYADGLTTDGPVDVEVYSWDPSNFGSYFTNDAFQNFLSGNAVNGILGIGDNAAGPTESPFQVAGFSGVEVTPKDLIIDPATPTGATVDGAPISTLYETVTTGGSTIGSTVSDDVDSGGVYGTIPASLYSALEPGSVITVYSSQGGTELYSYPVGSSDTFPTSVSGTNIDSGYIPFTEEPIYINYTDDMMTFVGK